MASTEQLIQEIKDKFKRWGVGGTRDERITYEQATEIIEHFERQLRTAWRSLEELRGDTRAAHKEVTDQQAKLIQELRGRIGGLQSKLNRLEGQS